MTQFKSALPITTLFPRRSHCRRSRLPSNAWASRLYVNAIHAFKSGSGTGRCLLTSNSSDGQARPAGQCRTERAIMPSERASGSMASALSVHCLPLRLHPFPSPARSHSQSHSLTIIRTMSATELPFPELPRTNEGNRICQVIKVKPEALDEYKKGEVRPDLMATSSV